jgi:hypothetical protein
MAFLLLWGKDSYTVGEGRDSFCCLHAYMYYNPNCFISISPLLSSLHLFPWWPQPV